MPHVGKFYPVWNPARRLQCDLQWPFALPTEFKWTVDRWTGTYGTGAPTSGRGMLPVGYDPTLSYIDYFADVPPILGPPFQIRLRYRCDGVAPSNIYDVQVLVASVPQLNWSLADFYGQPNDQFNGINGGNYDPLFGAVAWPASFIQIAAYKWTDPLPKPPVSAPF